MTAVKAFHVAFLVADIDASMAKFEAVLGVRFHVPCKQDLTISTMHEAEPHPYGSYITYSVEGPPHFELVQADGSDYKSLSQGERIHHVGLWVPDVERQRQVNAANGLRDELSVLYSDRSGVRQWFNDPISLHGVRLEFFDADWEPHFIDWVTTPWPGDEERALRPGNGAS